MYNILGYRNIKYTRKADNTTVSGKEFYLIDLEAVQGVEGNQCITVFLYDSKISGDVSVGSDAELQFQILNGEARVSGIICK